MAPSVSGCIELNAMDEPAPLITQEELAADLAALAAEAVGWLPLGEGAYLHLGELDAQELVITVTGVPDVGMAGMNVLLLC